MWQAIKHLTKSDLTYRITWLNLRIIMLGKLKKRKRLKTHGFQKRSDSVLKKRRAKGRKELTVSVHWGKHKGSK